MRFNPLLAIAATFIVRAACQATVIYDNLTTSLGVYLGGFSYVEAADDVALGPGPRVFERLTVAYAGFNFDGDETLTATLYAMDGAPTPGSFGFNTPRHRAVHVNGAHRRERWHHGRVRGPGAVRPAAR